MDSRLERFGDCMRICEHCLQAIESRGEKLITLEHGSLDEECTCEWCKEEMSEAEDYYDVEFK